MTERRIARSADDDDRRMRALFLAVPRRMPSTALQSRLLAATRSAWPVAAEARDWAVGSELVVSGGVVIGAALLALVPVVLVIAAFFLDAGIVIRGLTHGCVMLIEWLNAGVSVWDLLARSSVVLGSAVASPAGTVVLLGGVLTASLALAGLSRVLPRQQGDV
jgi:hypothetical protein